MFEGENEGMLLGIGTGVLTPGPAPHLISDLETQFLYQYTGITCLLGPVLMLALEILMQVDKLKFLEDHKISKYSRETSAICGSLPYS